jgi:PqqA peptide cyclase
VNVLLPAPIGLLAELTHRCPLQCPYCSNPLALERSETELPTNVWARVFREAAELGVLHVHLSGGEPAARRDLVEVTAAASRAGLYTNLITSGIGLTRSRIIALRDAGLDHLQLSIQDSQQSSGDRIAGYRGAHERKLALARDVVSLGLPLTINVVLHRENLCRTADLVALAAEMGAGRIELAHAQMHGWALRNRPALLPFPDQLHGWLENVEQLRRRYGGRLVIDSVAPDYFARRPKPCMGGWGRRLLNVTPSGRALPCHAAETIPGLSFWSVHDHSLAEIWHDSPAFKAFRGTDWMLEPCRSCAARELDFGGCRCQAISLTGNARHADPACELSPFHDHLRQAREQLPATADFAPRKPRRHVKRCLAKNLPQ